MYIYMCVFLSVLIHAHENVPAFIFRYHLLAVSWANHLYFIDHSIDALTGRYFFFSQVDKNKANNIFHVLHCLCNFLFVYDANLSKN